MPCYGPISLGVQVPSLRTLAVLRRDETIFQHLHHPPYWPDQQVERSRWYLLAKKEIQTSQIPQIRQPSKILAKASIPDSAGFVTLILKHGLLWKAKDWEGWSRVPRKESVDAHCHRTINHPPAVLQACHPFCKPTSPSHTILCFLRKARGPSVQ